MVSVAENQATNKWVWLSTRSSGLRRGFQHGLGLPTVECPIGPQQIQLDIPSKTGGVNPLLRKEVPGGNSKLPLHRRKEV